MRIEKPPFADIRKWQVKFEVHQPFGNLPSPTVVVEEIQKSCQYRHSGKNRLDTGGQLVITLNGSGGIQIGEKTTILTPGMAFLHVHQDADISYFYPKNSGVPWNFIWIAFENGNIENLIAEINRNYGYLFDIDKNSELLKILWSYYSRAGEIIVLSSLEAANLTYTVLNLLCETKAQILKESKYSKLAAEVQYYIASRLHSGINVSKIAENFEISREHLTRIFMKQTGITPHEYIENERLKLASNLLRNANLPIAEIGYRCGYESYTAFFRAFKKKFKRSPGRKPL